MGDILGYIIQFVGIVISVFFAWWVYVIYIILVIIYYLFFADSGGGGKNAVPGTFDFPRITISDPIPVLFGTKWLKNENIVWYGDVKSVPWEMCT